MVRKVTFRVGTTPKYILGRYRLGRRAEFLFTTSDHNSGGGVGLNYNNIEITVPDNWGSQTLSPVTIEAPQSEDDSNATPVAYYKSMAESFELNIIMKVKGNLQTYYQLRDRFMLAFNNDDIEICISEPGVGDRYILGYISNMVMDEFRAQHNATCRATFVPIAPWYRKFGTSPQTKSFLGDITGESISGLSGHGVSQNGQTTSVYCSYMSCYKMSNVEGLTVLYCDPGDSSQLLWDYIIPSDIGEGVEYLTIFNDRIIGLSGQSNDTVGEYSIPAGMYGFSVNSSAMVYELAFTPHVPSPGKLKDD